MKTNILILSLSVVLSFVSYENALQISVDQRVGKCEPACLQGDVPCCIIEFIAQYLGSNTSNISITLSGQVRVQGTVIFSHIYFLSIYGITGHEPELVCETATSGFKFVKIHSLFISRVKITSCGAKHTFVRSIIIDVTMAITNCSDVTLTNVCVTNSSGTSLLIENTSGTVILTNVTIEHNLYTGTHGENGQIFARGLFIYFNSSVFISSYSITKCNFKFIRTPRYHSFDIRNVTDTADWLGYGLGGGLSIIFDGNASQNVFLVDKCIFQGNFAPYGAGMCIRFQSLAAYNSVFIKRSKFINCSSGIAGGGLEVGLSKRSLQPNNNTVFVASTAFQNNNAVYGGGTHVFAIPVYLTNERFDFANFTNCTWIDNTASYSPAVDISPARFDQNKNGILPVPIFRDCNFTQNLIEPKKYNQSTFTASGVFVITKFTVTFVGRFYFDNNMYTALKLTSAQLKIKESTHIQFQQNTGLRGGALALHGFSLISFDNNCRLDFIDNRATEFGGAIFYYTIEQREIIEGRVCFLRYTGDHSTKRNVTFLFSGNSASISGSAIYATSLFSCYYTYRGDLRHHNVCEFFEDIGDFIFDGLKTCPNRNTTVSVIGTSPQRFEQINSQLLSLPGKRTNLALSVIDELFQPINVEFYTRILETNVSLFLTNNYTVNDTISLTGKPHERASLAVSTQQIYRSIQFTLDVTLMLCPPGYYLDGTVCSCSADNPQKAYIGIGRCNNNNFSALIRSGYWAGYHSSNNKLYTGSCPLNFCAQNTPVLYSEHFLPNSSDSLNSEMCGHARKGILCGKCSHNYSVYYLHSRSFTCGANKNCQFGILIFVVSELLPVLIFFTIVVTFDISFSSGARNGFIFFSQMVTILPLDDNFISQTPGAKYLNKGYRLIYGIFSIDFFSIESFSFCLFKGAKVLDVLAFKYITIAFALVLVILLTVCLKHCTCCGKLCRSMKKLTSKESVLNGLSAFFIITYAESIRVSFFILRLKVLKGAGGVSGPVVAFYSGDAYFGSHHLLYAIPAIVTLATFALFPPLLLLLYPLTLRVLGVCRLSEHRLVTTVLRVIRINSLLPLLDVFQGYFRDNLRFFAGLYFLYRVALLINCLLIMSKPFRVCNHNRIDFSYSFIPSFTRTAIQATQA